MLLTQHLHHRNPRRVPGPDARGGRLCGVLPGLRRRSLCGTAPHGVLIFALLIAGFRRFAGRSAWWFPPACCAAISCSIANGGALFGFGLLAAGAAGRCVSARCCGWPKLSGGPAFMQDVIRMQFMGRMDGSEGASGVLYYFTSSMGNYALAYPLALLVLLAIALSKTARHRAGIAIGAVLRRSRVDRDARAFDSPGEKSPLPAADVAHGGDHCGVSVSGGSGAVVCLAAGVDARLWLLMPASADRRTAGRPATVSRASCASLASVLVMLGALQVLAAGDPAQAPLARADPGCLCGAGGVVGLYPGVRTARAQLYDTRTFSRAAV